MQAKKILYILPFFMSSVLAVEFCYNDVMGACSPTGGALPNCNAKYGQFASADGIGGVEKDLQNYVNVHIMRNFQFLLMSVHFKNFERQREGLGRLYRKYSDKTWEDSIELMKYITKRGGSMDFGYKKEVQLGSAANIDSYEMHELHSLSKALDIWKTIAELAFNIHTEVSRRQELYHDPEIISYIENKFVHDHAEIIRDLSGNTNDLKRLLSDTNDASLALYLFDNMLKA